MPTFIKTGYWDKKAKAPEGWLDLNLFVQTLIPPTPPPTPSTNIYNSDGTLTGNRIVQGNNNNLTFQDTNEFNVFTEYAKLTISNNAQEIATGSTNRIWGIKLDFFSNLYYFGQYNGQNPIVLNVDATNNKTISTQDNLTIKGLKINLANRVYELGQINGGNATTLKIDDAAAFPVQVSGTNVSQTTSGTASGKFLKIKVDGVDYVIELKNPS